MKIIDINYFNNSTLPFNFESKSIYSYKYYANRVKRYESTKMIYMYKLINMFKKYYN